MNELQSLKAKLTPDQTKIIEALELMHKDNVISNIILADILQSKAEQAEVVALWQERCEVINKAKSRGTWVQVFIGVIAVAIAIIPLWLGLTRLSPENPAVKSLMGLFL